MSFEKYNNHPKGLTTNDCVVRTISKTFDREYLEVRRELNRIKKEVEEFKEWLKHVLKIAMIYFKKENKNEKN